MKIKFIDITQLEVVTHFDEDNDQAFTEDETFKKGEIIDVDILERRDKNTDFQFGDGSVAYCVDNTCFEIL